jgi:hypothetical protein
MFLGLLDPDPIFRGKDPDLAPDPLLSSSTIVRQTLNPTVL